METSDDKQWAQKYLLDPLNEPEPSEETGPASHFRSTFAPADSLKSSSQIEVEKKEQARLSVHGSKKDGLPTPPQSASPRHSQFPHRNQAFGEYHHRSSSVGRPSSEVPTSSLAPTSTGTHTTNASPTSRQRGNSLTERYPGDTSHRPLEILRRHSKKAHRSPHLQRKAHHGPDIIDKLDSTTAGAYHHASPYDVVSIARNQDFGSSPVEALAASTEETLKATPKEKIMDSIVKRKPLDGVAMFPPGTAGPDGGVMSYNEGGNMMVDYGGNYKRWDGREYHPNDIKGKGEPSYSIEKALKDHKTHKRNSSLGDIEMTNRPRGSSPLNPNFSPNSGLSPTQAYTSGRARASSGAERPRSDYAEWEDEVRRGQNEPGMGSRLTKRFGSLRRKPVPNREEHVQQ